MTTPVADFINEYINSSPARFHMPGHKGVGDIEKFDITEIAGADVLYSASGIIDESEGNVTELFGTAHSFYSTEGSTLAIKAMLFLATQGKSKAILAARNVHKAFIYGCALLDLNIEWLYPEEFSHLCSCKITAEDVENKLSEMKELPCAVYVTSPDYLGNIADIRKITEVCKAAGIPLIVDNAHGAYLNFLDPSLHPMAQGAAMCTDSAHKTLPVLTGGAYLHISKEHAHFANNARSALSLFASTSPSYLIMRSLDLCNEYMEKAFKKELTECIEKIDEVKDHFSSLGIPVEKSEPLKIVINAYRLGYTGEELGDILRKEGIEPEFCDCEYLVLMPSPKNTDEDFRILAKAFEKIEKKAPITPIILAPAHAKQVMTAREAVFSPCEKISVDRALGRICASPSVSCPPAVPIAVSGEVIEEKEIALFKHYGISEVEVVK